MDKVALLTQFARARERARQGTLEIGAQNEVVRALEQRGLDAAVAKATLVKIITQRDRDLGEMDRLLDELEGQDTIAAVI